MRVVLVTGSRDWADGRAVFDALEGLRPDHVIHGAHNSGADMDASMYASTACNEIPMPANWYPDGKTLDRSAGPKRNTAMVQVLSAFRSIGAECFVLAFPEAVSAGTRDCMRKARAAGFDVDDRGRV